MKIVVSATSDDLDAQIDPRFGRCPYFVIVDTETMSFETLRNTAAGAAGGAGNQAAQMVASKGVQVVLTGSVGPNAFRALSITGIRIVTGVQGTVREAVEKFKRGQSQEIIAPTAPMRFGMSGGYGMGMGRGRGLGRGMGRGYWQGARPFAPQEPLNATPTPLMQPRLLGQQEIQMLENQMKYLQKLLDQTRKRLAELRNES